VIRKYHILLLFMLLLSVRGCIEPYETEIEEETRLLTVEGSIIKGEELQTIVISETTSLLDPRFKAVKGCEVRVLDDQFNEFLFDEGEEGSYTRIITDEQLVPGRQYMLRITTPGGEVYESDYELLNPEAEVDSVYYGIEEKLDATSGEDLNGVQFYIDIKASDDVPRFFRWNLDETYEYTASVPISYFYFNPSFEPFTPDNPYEFYRCWITERVKGLYLSNTINLTTNQKKKIPLHYVSTLSDRMKIRYNLLVKQYTMNEGAYDYWQQNKTATMEGGGLYTGQPDQPLSNLCNVTDSTERVLGYFWASTMTEKRIVVPRPNDLMVPDEGCVLTPFDPMIHKGPFPIYIRIDEKSGELLTGSQYCFNCTERGGSLEPPDFWE
jgi:hypothetical protein